MRARRLQDGWKTDPVEWLNYHHLRYFWIVAREGSITAAARRLRLAQPTISGQVRTLEESLGEKLFERSGRRLTLTEVGTVVYRYADEIFRLGRELQDTLEGRPTGRPVRLQVGISDALPKLITYRLLAPALSMLPPVQLVCREGQAERLLGELAVHGLDLVLSDRPAGSTVGVRAYDHPLGECGVAFFGVEGLAQRHAAQFPASLEDAPMLLPTEGTPLRRDLDRWLLEQGIRPRIVAEISDSSLLKVFGQHGDGIFVTPDIIEDEVTGTYGVRVIGRTDAVRERFFAISVERRIVHPAVALITEAARTELSQT